LRFCRFWRGGCFFSGGLAARGGGGAGLGLWVGLQAPNLQVVQEFVAVRVQRSFLNTLSGRFLGLMAIFVVIAEVLIFVPAVARFRVEYIQSRLELAQLGALALLAAPDAMVGADLEQELLTTAGVYNVVLRRAEIRELVLMSEEVPAISAIYDLREASDLRLMRDAMAVLIRGGDRTIGVIGRTEQGAQSDIEITLPEAPLRAAMVAYGLRILYISLAISLCTAALLFLAVRYLIVRPIDRVVAHMVDYRDAPEDASRIIEPRGGARELAEAEVALRDLQQGLTSALRQKERLAALGGAVAKISHDLRNMLTTVQLLADRLEASEDPAVRRNAPKLVGSLSRAVSLCERTLAFGRAEERPPELSRIRLAPLVEEVLEAEQLAVENTGVRLVAAVPADVTVRADPEHLFRVLANLARNASQAIAADGKEGEVRIEAEKQAGTVEIRVVDTGPGLPAKARENLFQPFTGGARRGGTGLGLAIAADLVRGHGGRLSLAGSGRDGTVFQLTLPDERG
jgi:signal transduction histidine kinase